jgi:Lon protease-like protein
VNGREVASGTGLPASFSAMPIFPLPNAVLLPHAVLPLHVFEPRYRTLVRDCVSGDRILAVALLQPGWAGEYEGRPSVRRVIGVGEIVGHETLSDGRSNILLRGLVRATIRAELALERPYRVVQADRLADRYPSGHDLGPARVALEALCDAVAARLPDEGAALLRQLTHLETDPAVCADVVAAALVMDVGKRQSVLEALDVDERLDRVTRYAADVLARLEAEQGKADHADTN